MIRRHVKEEEFLQNVLCIAKLNATRRRHDTRTARRRATPTRGRGFESRKANEPCSRSTTWLSRSGKRDSTRPCCPLRGFPRRGFCSAAGAMLHRIAPTRVRGFESRKANEPCSRSTTWLSRSGKRDSTRPCCPLRGFPRRGFCSAAGAMLHRIAPTRVRGFESRKANEPCSRSTTWLSRSGKRDSNPRPLAPHASALPDCATARLLNKKLGKKS